MAANFDVTIGIPTRNAGPSFGRTLQAIFAQETSRTVEVIALDSGSTDGTLELLRQYPVRIIEVDQATFDWGRVRERLFQSAQAPLVANLSQDAIPAHNQWLENLLEPLNDPAVGASCGSSIPDPERHFKQFQWERNGYYYFTREIGKFTRKYGKGLSFANTAVPKRIWEQFHIEPQATGEDFQFQMKLHGAGIPIAFPKEAQALHHHNYTLKGVFRRCRNEGLALRGMGCPYNEWDLVCDVLSLPKYIQWLREVKYQRLESSAEWLYPFIRPWAVYKGSRFARHYIWY